MTKEDFNNKIEEQKIQRKINILEYWKTLKPFVLESDVPNIPKYSKEEHYDFFIPKLIECGAIPKNKLENGIWYYGNYRNSDLGKWNEEKQRFFIWRYKFGWMSDDCNHFQDDDGYALFVPIREAYKQEVESLYIKIGIIK